MASISTNSIYNINGVLTTNVVEWEIPVTSNVNNPTAFVQVQYPSDFAFSTFQITSVNASSYNDTTKIWTIPLNANEVAKLKLTFSFTAPVDLEKIYEFIAGVNGLDTINSNNNSLETIEYRSVVSTPMGGANPDKTSCTCVDVSTNDTPCTQGVSEWRLNVSSIVNGVLQSWDVLTGKGDFTHIDPTKSIKFKYDFFCVQGVNEFEISPDVEVEIYPQLANIDVFDHTISEVKGADLTPAQVALLQLAYPTLDVVDTDWYLLSNAAGEVTSGVPKPENRELVGTMCANNGQGSTVFVWNNDGELAYTLTDGTDYLGNVLLLANCCGGNCGGSSATVTSADGSIDVVGSDLSVTHTVNPDGSVTLNDGTVIPAPTPQLTPAQICASIAATCNSTLGSFTPVVNLDGSTTYTAVFTGNDGVPTNVTFTIPAAGSETITTIVNNGDGTATYTNEVGTPITFPIGGVTAADNGDGTYTLTLADGSTVTISDTSTSTMVDNLDGTYTYTDETGLQTTFDTTGVVTTITNTVTGNKIADYTNELGAVVPINESITSFAAITDGYQFTAEDGTVYPFTFTFDNTTPSSPQLLINYGATTVSSIPLNSYDVNISTTGGFVLNPLTDVITITETDGETHTIDLSYLKTTFNSTDGSVQLVTSVNPDGSTNYDLGVKDIHSVNILGTGVYDSGNPLSGWVQPTGAVQGNTAQVYFTDGRIVNFTFNDPLWEEDFPINIANRPWGTATIPTPKTADSVNIGDDIHHTGKANIGGVLTHQTFYDAQIDNGLRVHGPTRNTYDNYAINSATLNVNPTTGNDFLEPREYIDNAGVFQTLNAAINYLNNSSFTGFNTIVLTGTTALAPALLGGVELMRGKVTNINANGQFISITGDIENYGTIALNWGTYTFTGNFQFVNFYNSGFYAYTPTFNLSATNTTVHFLFRVGASGVFDNNTINYVGNNTSFAAMETSTSVNLFTTNFQTNGFTGCKLAKEPFNTYANSNTFNVNTASWTNISAQALDVTHCTIIYDNRYYHGFVTLPTLVSITDQNLNVYAGNLKIYDVLKFDNNTAATVDVGVVWATSATNTVSLPEGVLMIKY